MTPARLEEALYTIDHTQRDTKAFDRSEPGGSGGYPQAKPKASNENNLVVWEDPPRKKANEGDLVK
jgi:hypothetical protein